MGNLADEALTALGAQFAGFTPRTVVPRTAAARVAAASLQTTVVYRGMTFAGARRHLGVETLRQWSDTTIARATPALLGRYSLVMLMGP